MSTRFDAIAGRRAVLLEEIGQTRGEMTLAAMDMRKELAWASLGLVASQLVGRKRWLRITGLAVLAVSLGRPLLARFFPGRG